MEKKPIDRCQRVPLERATAPSPSGGLYWVYVNLYWAVTPEREILFFRSLHPQGNAERHTAEQLRDRLYPDCTVEQLPMVFVEEDPASYT